MRHAWSTSIAAAILVLAGCSGNGGAGSSSGMISRADLGDAWPFLVESGTLHCAPGGAVTFEAAGVTYAVNGVAMGRADDEGWRDIDPIWADDPALTGTKINIGQVIQRGLALCD